MMTERIKVKQMNESIYLLDDNGEAAGYLVVGREKAEVWFQAAFGKSR